MGDALAAVRLFEEVLEEFHLAVVRVSMVDRSVEAQVQIGAEAERTPSRLRVQDVDVLALACFLIRTMLQRVEGLPVEADHF